MGSQLIRIAIGVLAVAALGGANWVNPVPSPAPAAARAPQPVSQEAPGSIPQPGQDDRSVSTQAAPIEVTDWRLRGGRLILTLHGSAAALDLMRSQGQLTLQLHWMPAGAPARVTELPVGRANLVPALTGEVRRQGYFSWHSWAEKRALGRGGSVSLTLSDGTPVTCAAQQGPCRFSLGTG